MTVAREMVIAGLAWGAEPPVASFVAVPGTPCRCTLSRGAVERVAGIAPLGPAACLAAIERHRAQLELIAARKYAREGAGSARCIHVTSADVWLVLAATSQAFETEPPSSAELAA